MILMIAALTSVLGATYNVPGDFATLQAAHDAASAGDTLRVYGAQPGPLRITKSITQIFPLVRSRLPQWWPLLFGCN